MRYSIQHGNITTTASRGQGGSRFEPQPKGYGMSQNHHFECPQATFDSGAPQQLKMSKSNVRTIVSVGKRLRCMPKTNGRDLDQVMKMSKKRLEI